jgi:hypothetical protein
MAAAIQPAISPAIAPWSDSQTVVGSVATPRYPGPIESDHSGGPQTRAPGSVEGPPDGQGYVGYHEELPEFSDIAGSLGDTAPDMYGHAAPVADFDSSAGNQFGSGPIADTHSVDTGGVERKSTVLMPRVGNWFRRTLTGQTYNRESYSYDSTGKMINTPNDRIDLDQYQGHNADAYDPYWQQYGERPVLLNVAHEPVPFSTPGLNPYSPAGDLGPVGPQFWTDQSNVYEAPPDPQANTDIDTSVTPFFTWGS